MPAKKIMLDIKRIELKLRELRRRVSQLEELRDIEETKFIVNDLTYDAAERRLQIAIQSCIDIASHIVAQKTFEVPKDTTEVFLILAKHNILPFDFAESIKKMAGQRNILIHEYLEIERQIIYETIQTKLPDLLKFASHIQKFIDKEKNEAANETF